MESLDHPISPQMAAGIAATENAWLEMAAEPQRLDGRSVARIAGSKQATGSLFCQRPAQSSQTPRSRTLTSLVVEHVMCGFNLPGWQLPWGTGNLGIGLDASLVII